MFLIGSLCCKEFYRNTGRKGNAVALISPLLFSKTYVYTNTKCPMSYIYINIYIIYTSTVGDIISSRYTDQPDQPDQPMMFTILRKGSKRDIYQALILATCCGTLSESSLGSKEPAPARASLWRRRLGIPKKLTRIK